MIATWRAFWDAVEQARVPGLEVTRGEIDETHAGGRDSALTGARLPGARLARLP